MICLKIRTFVVSATTARRGEGLGICCDLLENSYLCGISNNPRMQGRCQSMLWFAWKFVPLWYQQQLWENWISSYYSCDLLENSYLCGISNNTSNSSVRSHELWFAWKFVPLWYQQQHISRSAVRCESCDLLENSYLCGISNNSS